ncbi:TIGR02677 family protein [Streptomyces microflavus]|uniref:TIGR02677 family protein n=1 Tax=Streptomyces microflavus TaxID=1919 RepID=UPI0033CB34D0
MIVTAPGASAGPLPEPSGFGPFAHLTVPNTPLYRHMMRAFLTAKERFAVHLRPEDVHTALPTDARPAEPDAVVGALDRLVGWGNLRANPDTGRVTAVEDFYRKRFIYQLTREGEAAEEALSAYDEALGRRGALQAVALHDIVTQLRALLVLAAEEQPDPAKAHLALDALASRFAALADNARAFMGSLQQTIDLHDVEEAVFLAYKDRLIQYLERFIQDLITLGGRIARLILELEELGQQVVRRQCEVRGGCLLPHVGTGLFSAAPRRTQPVVGGAEPPEGLGVKGVRLLLVLPRPVRRLPGSRHGLGGVLQLSGVAHLGRLAQRCLLGPQTFTGLGQGADLLFSRRPGGRSRPRDHGAGRAHRRGPS